MSADDPDQLWTMISVLSVKVGKLETKMNIIAFIAGTTFITLLGWIVSQIV